MLARRKIQQELLDRAKPSEARSNLADLVRINRYFGGHSTIRQMLERVVKPDEPFSMLDVGAASGDTAEMIVRWYPQARVTSLDNNAVNLKAAPPPKLLADAFQLPFAPRSFDFVMSSLFLHHFPDEDVTALLRSFRLLARRGVLIADLERHVFPLLFLRLSKPFFGWRRITVHDGLRSVRASFRAAELKKLAEAAGIDNPFVEVHRPAFRLTLLAADLRASALHPVSR